MSHNIRFSKKPKFIKSIKSLRNELDGGKKTQESSLYNSREEFIQNILEFIMKKKDINIL
ncbi:MAG: hypothetical protein ACFFAO_18425 [Candidatus Hermodarchaeota archaeon]